MSIQNIIDRAKSLGLQVYAPSNLTSYIYVTDGTNIGYCQYDKIEGESFSTVHKPCKSNGTGFGVDRMNDIFINRPYWAVTSAPVIKYKSIDDFLANHWNKLVEY